MANTGFRGVDVRQGGNQIVFRALIMDSSNAIVTSGSATLKIYELQSDGTLSSYDFSSNTFKTTALTTETASLTHRTGNNATTNTGIWTYALATLTGFTYGAVYFAVITHASGSPTVQIREFQYGLVEGDLYAEQGTGYVKIAASGLSYSSIDDYAKAVMGGRMLVGTATTSPITATVWSWYGTTYNSYPLWHSTNNYFMWNNGSGWTISATAGTNGASYFTSSTGITGPWTAQGSATGTPAFSYFGLPLTDNFGLLSVDSSGRTLLQPTQTGVTIPAVTTVGSVTGAVGSVTGNVGGNVVGSVASVSGNLGGNVNGNVVGTVGSVTGAVGSVTGSVGSVAGSVAGDLSGKVLGGGSSTITGSGVQASSVVGSVGSVSGSVGSVAGAVGSVTGNVGGDVVGKVLGGGSSSITGDGVRASSVTGAVGSVTGAVGSVTGSVGSVVADVPLDESAIAAVLFVDGATNKLKVNDDGTVNTTVDTSGVATDVANILFVDGVTNKLKVNTDHSVKVPTTEGTGVNTVTITIQTTGSVAIQNARVSAWSGSTLVATSTTNVSGVAVLAIDNGTYSINVTANGYNGTSNSLEVSEATSHTYQLSALSITPSDPPEVTGYLTCYDELGAVKAGVAHTISMLNPPPNDTGSSFSQAPRTVQSDADGLVQFNGLIAGATYKITRSKGSTQQFIADDTTFEIPACAG